MKPVRLFPLLILLVVLFLGVPAAEISRAEPGLQPSSVPGIMIPEGFDAEIFATGLEQPGHLVFESTGNLVAGRDGTVAARPVVRLSPEGVVVALSDPIADPDGVAVDSEGRVFVAGDGKITIANSLDGGTDEILATGFSNLNNIAIDTKDRIVVAENDGRIREVTATGVIVEPPLAELGQFGNPLAFDSADRLFAGTVSTTGLPGSLVRIIDGEVIPVTTELINGSSIAFGPGGAFGNEIFVAEAFTGRVRKVDESTGNIATFATGFDFPYGLAFDGADALFVSDQRLGRIIRIFPAMLEASIDIRPWSKCNVIVLHRWWPFGIVPVAILTTLDFDATTVDPDTVNFAGAPAKWSRAFDVDRDGDKDLLLIFRTRETSLTPEDVEACLDGETYDGVPIVGCDSVRTVP